MKQIAMMVIVLVFTAVEFSSAAEKVATAQGSNLTVRVMKSDSQLLLHVSDTAKAFGWEAKIVVPGKLITICSEGEGGVCIPLRLKKLKSSGTGEELYVEAAALEKALSFRAVETDGKILLKREMPSRMPRTRFPPTTPLGGKGRGFHEGETLPDIPLYDMEGNEVRFSQFLGQQYILYCWASW